MISIGLNGLGRIGRNFFRAYLNDKSRNFTLTVINDIADKETLIHLLNVSARENDIHVRFTKNGIAADHEIIFNRFPIEKLSWKQGELIIEATGKYFSRNLAEKHLNNGARAVIISAPAENPDATLVPGINDELFDPQKHKIISSASCTAQAVIPIIKSLEPIGIDKLFISTIHPYTVNNMLLDMPGRNFRESRSCTLSIVPAQTRADIAFEAIFPDIDFKAYSFKIPTSKVALIDLVIRMKRKTSRDEVNGLLKDFSSRFPQLLEIIDTPLVSADMECSHSSSVADITLTETIDDLVRVFAWYDNEWAYSMRLYELTKIIASRLN